MSATASSTRNRLVATVAERLAASILPGEENFSPTALDDAASFVVATAEDRESGSAAIAIESVPGAVGERLLRIAVVNDDMPFLVDSVSGAVAAQGLAIDRLAHPVLIVRRDDKGKLIGSADADADGAQRESMIYLETERADARTRRQLLTALEGTLADVRAAVTDWPAMQVKMAADADTIADDEGAALLRWMKDGALTQLGHVTRRRDGSNTEALGLCRRGAKQLLGPISYERAFTWFDKAAKRKDARLPLIVKSNRISTVHRRTPLDLFIVPVVEDGKVEALSVHAGIWTSAALGTPPDRIPGLRAQLARQMNKLDFEPNSHAGKALVHAMTALPHDLLVSFEDDDLARIALRMMSLVDRPRPSLALVMAPLDRHLFAFVWLPRDAMSTATRLQIQSLLTAGCEAPVLDWSLQVEGGSLAMLRFVMDLPEKPGKPDEAALDAQLQTMLRGWGEAVENELARHEEAGRAAALAARFADAFPIAFRTHGPAEAAADILRLRLLATEGEEGAQRAARLFRRDIEAPDRLRLKIYQRKGTLPLSDAVPALENFGFRVLGEMPTLLDEGRLGAIHDFELALPFGTTAEALVQRAGAIEAALTEVLNGTAENDPFNRLVSGTGLAAHEANWLRAWYRYLRQAGMNYGIATVVDALAAAPQVARGLVDLFVARHDPSISGDRDKAGAKAEEAIREGLARVSAINDDRLLRAYRSMIDAMLRTNAFIPAGRDALAFKLDSVLIPGLPKPVPWREIFVYSRRVEGIHLRAGPVARGGLRWSDRRDDFRTEILGLMKAQRVKNAVIVPTGAKGGFYPKQLPDPSRDREGWLAEGRASYQVFIRSMLSITDNLVKGKVVHPKGILVRDGEDPYFVVAADKGTASFSDTANAIAEEFDFWLDDAFASGGSKGYDHKAMGITARGAWLSVQRHFLEMGIDVQTDSVRVAGCGDMSGDVFGNGMLLSKALRLVAAFDHRHIFIDPSPDPAKSWAERQRLFDLPRSSWDDYDKALISKGGGVFPRSQKEIPLSAQAREVLGIDAHSMDPDSLINAILKSPVDLLWFGGIGTYVKSSAENNATVGDPSNDSVRVDGGQVRAKVIGEGANLGCTQAGRIEFALQGGRNNTDFIDNSAGVDCSDNEVNIKIALASAKRAGRLSENRRVQLLEDMTGEVSALVLEDNRLQALALSIAGSSGVGATASHIRIIETLEEAGHLDRRTEGLADNETLIRRAADGQGLTRPELAVLLSSTKLALQDAFEESALPDDPGMGDELVSAFPAAMQGKYKKDIASHRLRREIVATKLANRLINRMGIIHPFELAEEEGASLAQTGAAFAAAQQMFGMQAIWQAIESASMGEQARLLLFGRAAQALRAQMADLLRASPGTLVPSKAVSELAPGVRALSDAATELLAGEARTQSGKTLSALLDAGAPEREALMVAHLFDMDGAIGLARLARDSEVDIRTLTHAFGDIGARLGLDWARMTASRMNPSDPWERLLVGGLARDFQQVRLEFLRRVAGRKVDLATAVSNWADANALAIAQFRKLVARAQAAAPPTPAMLARIASQSRSLLARRSK
ncbi:MAG: NAD-glutamate dehydrogenase domain-containing protein [Novosphingobium sp.]